MDINNFLLYCIVLYCIVLYCIVLYCIVLYCIVLVFNKTLTIVRIFVFYPIFVPFAFYDIVLNMYMHACFVVQC